MKKIRNSILIFVIVILTITSTVVVSAISYKEQTGTVETTNGATASAKFTPTPTQCSASIRITSRPNNSSVSVFGSLTGKYIITLSSGETYTDTAYDSGNSDTKLSLSINCPSNARWDSLETHLTLSCDGESNSLSFTAN